MRISYNWIKNLVDLPKDVTSQQLAHDLTMATVEVEEVIDQAQGFDKMIVGKVLELKKHPNADQLQLAITDIGESEPGQIVCGGTNLFEGMQVAVALPGAKVRWHGEGDLVALEKTKIRGEESYGMICASDEIGLDEVYPSNEKEILNISFCEAKPGTPLAQALNFTDTILEIDNKSLTNRPDLWSHYGIARELAAIYKTKLNDLELSKLNIGKSKNLKIKIKSKNCRRYMGLVVEGVEIKNSPDWMQQRLIAAGMRPINNIVDLTNYVMLETGEPMHAFDYDNIADGTIVVRQANDKEILKTLDGDDYKLDKDVLVIADTKQAVALAGIKGGANSGISEKTSKIIIESANFDPLSIRKTSTKFNLRTDASQRHEKALDLERAAIGLGRLIKILQEILPEAKLDTVVDQGHSQTDKVEVKTNKDFIVGRLGHDLSVKQITDLLTPLGFQIKTKGNDFTITVPSWRATGDVSIPEDIVEEVGRLYGYDKLEPRALNVSLTAAVYQPAYIFERKIKEYLAKNAGFNEVYNYPWTDDKILDLLKVNQDNLYKIANPPTVSTANLHDQLLPNLLTLLEKNLSNYESFRIFELARVFAKNQAGQEDYQDNLPEQPKKLAGIVVANQDQAFRILKGSLVGLFEILNINKYNFNKINKYEFLSATEQIEVSLNGQVVGFAGYLNDIVIKELGLKFSAQIRLAVFEIDVFKILQSASFSIAFQVLPEFPNIERDMAVVFGYKVTWQEVEELVRSVDPLVSEVKYLSTFDLQGKQSIAFRVKYSSPQRTLLSTEVVNIEKKIVEILNSKLNGELRK